MVVTAVKCLLDSRSFSNRKRRSGRSRRFSAAMVTVAAIVIFAVVGSIVPTQCDAFVVPKTSNLSSQQHQFQHLSQNSRSSSATSSSSSLFASAPTSGNKQKNVIVVSPPGGVGEVAAVKAAGSGSNVRWFVINSSSNNNDGGGGGVSLSPQTLQDIDSAGGSLELAGATIDELSTTSSSGNNNNDIETALNAISTWCTSDGFIGDGLVCTYDDGSTIETSKDRDPSYLEQLVSAVRLASKEAAKTVSGPCVAVLAAEEELLADVNDDSGGDESNSGGGGFLGSLFGNSVSVPTSLSNALMSSSSSSSSKKQVCIVRHGQLFGMPESSPDFSPLVGGPKRQPVITEEYTMRNVRVDPFVVSGNVMSASSTTRTCRHCLGEAAALFAAGSLPTLSQPISITSQLGSDEFVIEQWQQEIERVQDLVKSGQASTLFSQEMIVEDTERLADWLATKWAPAVLRTYDIAAIRTGARPVYATRPAAEGGDGISMVEVTWQELINFDSVMVGKMILQVTKDGIRCTRGPGDPSKGYGKVSPLPLPGEDVLVRRLAEAASQAVEKGLAKKVPRKKSATKAAAPVPVTSLQSSGDVVVEPQSSSTATAVAPPPPTTTTTADETTAAEPQTGPRQAGARRSTPRSRGSGKKKDE